MRRKLIVILSITCIAFYIKAGNYSPDERNKHANEKKNKVKKEDTTKTVLSQEIANESETDEIPDTAQITFPSHDLYNSWDVKEAHPYKFGESFKEDSVTITLVNDCDGAFVLPTKGDLTSLFGWRRYRPHYGTDIKVNTGEEVVAAFDGMVRISKYYHGYGNCVIIRHNNGLETVYAHLSKILVESGQKVFSGTLLGLAGNTGHSYGSHLHFEIRYLGQALDTQDFIDFETGELLSNKFTLRRSDVENKYDLRALHYRHKHDLGFGKYRNYGSAKRRIYRVKRGDTLGAIAIKGGVTVKDLCRKNRIKTTSVLRVGQMLKF